MSLTLSRGATARSLDSSQDSARLPAAARILTLVIAVAMLLTHHIAVAPAATSSIFTTPNNVTPQLERPSDARYRRARCS